jgi:hypothetical protein
MLNRRDILSIVGYGVLFAAVVLWAELRPASVDLANPHEPTRAEMMGASIAMSGDQPELRRLVKHTKNP